MNARLLTIPLLTLAMGAASADNVRIPLRNPPPNSPEGVPRPVRGMTMDAVRERFGEPKSRLPAVGNPPITRWIYDRYTVYFEHDLTLHVVVVAAK